MIEIPNPLSPIYVNTFAYNTFKDRLPVILARIVDSLYRNKKLITDELGSDKVECLKYITAEMSRLRHELTTNKPLSNFDECLFGDEEQWNNAIVEERNRLIGSGITNDEICWYQCSFLFGECYMYRRVYDAVLKSGFAELDQFSFEKAELLERAIGMQLSLMGFLNDILPKIHACNKLQLFSYFETILKMSLWGNEVDLSLSIEEEEAKVKLGHPEKIIQENNNKLLIDDTRQLFEFIFEKSIMNEEEIVVTLFLDNSGSELLGDLHFIEFLLASKLARKVVLFVKSMPWYVSDVTERDFQWTVRNLCQSNDNLVRWLGNRIHSRITDDASLVIKSHHFLTLPHPYCKMERIYPDLYSELSHSTILIFKGDLNYRKLVSDLQWPIVNTTFNDSLLGFHPAPIVALRVLKCDVQVGLTNDVLSRVIKERPDDWMCSSKYGVVQLCLTDR